MSVYMKGEFVMALIDQIGESIEMLIEARKDLCNGRWDEAESKVEIVRIILNSDEISERSS